jgi:hypothetical protein
MNSRLRAFEISGFSHPSLFQSGYLSECRISCHMSTSNNGLDLLQLFVASGFRSLVEFEGATRSILREHGKDPS